MNRYPLIDFDERRRRERAERERRIAANRAMRERGIAAAAMQAGRTGQGQVTPGTFLERPGMRPSIPGTAGIPAPEPERFPQKWKPELGSWFGSGVLENIAGEGISAATPLLQKLEPVLQPLSTATKALAGGAVSQAAGLTSPLGPIAPIARHFGVRGKSFVPFLREFQEIEEKQYKKARAEGLDPLRATFVAYERGLEEKKFPVGVQGALELVFDPLNVVGFGTGAVAKKAATAIAKRGKRIIGERAGERVGDVLVEPGIRPKEILSTSGVIKIPQAKKIMSTSEIVEVPDAVLLEPNIRNLRHLAVDGFSSDEIYKAARADKPSALGALALGEEFLPRAGKRVTRHIIGPIMWAASKIDPTAQLLKTELGQATFLHAKRSASLRDRAGASVAFMRDPDFMKAAGLNAQFDELGNLKLGHVSEDLVTKLDGGKTADVVIDGKLTNRAPTTHYLGFFEDAFAKDKKGNFFYGGKEGLWVSNPKLAEQIAEAHRVMDEANAFGRAYGGFKAKDIVPGEGLTGEGSRFFHRGIDYLAEATNQDMIAFSNRSGKGRFAPKQPSGAKLRKYSDGAQNIVDGLEDGVPYMTNPAASAEEYVFSILKSSTDEQFANSLRALKSTMDIEEIDVLASALKNKNGLSRRLGKMQKAADRLKVVGGVTVITNKTLKALGEAGLAKEVEELRKIDSGLGLKTQEGSRDIVGTYDPRYRRNPHEISAEEHRERMIQAVKNSIEGQRKKAQDDFEKATTSANVLRKDLRTARGLKEADVEGVFVNAPHLRDLIFTDPKEAQKIAERLGVADMNGFVKVAEGFAKTGDALRVMQTGYDFGAMFLQGLPALAVDLAQTPFALIPAKLSLEKGGILGRQLKVGGLKNPLSKEYWADLPVSRRWGKAAAHHIKAFFDPKVHEYYMAANRETVKEMVTKGNVGLSRAASDWYQGLQRDAYIPSALRKLEKGGRLGAGVSKVIGGATKRFERSFNSFGDVIRTETWKAMRDTAAKSGDEGLSELGQFIRNSTGAFNSAGMGITASQQSIERGWLFFSPRYTRASLALIADVFQGGLAGNQARKSMAAMLAVGIGMNYAVSEAMGQKPNIDPSKPNFMTVEIAGQNVGPGSFFMSFLRLHAKILKKAGEDPMDLRDPNTENNPILRWIRGRSSPVSGLAWDTAVRSDFLGNKLETPLAWGKHIGTQAMPFAVEAALMTDGSSVAGRLTGLGAESGGARVIPVSDWQRRKSMRENLAFNNYDGSSWEDLNELQQRDLELKNKPLRDINEAVSRDRLAHGYDMDELVDRFHRNYDKAQDEWVGEVKKAYGFLEDGIYSIPRFIEEAGDATARKRHIRDALQSSDEYTRVREYFTDIQNRGLGHPEAPEDIAYAEFVTIITNPEYEEGALYDYEQRDTDISEFRDRVGEEVYNYIQARFDQGKDIPDLLKEYYAGKERFRYYWDGVEEQVMQSRLYDESTVRAMYAEWKTYAGNRDLQDAFEREHPSLRGILKTMSRVKIALRKQDSELDAYLYRFCVGGINTLKASENRGREIDLRSPVPGIALTPLATRPGA